MIEHERSYVMTVEDGTRLLSHFGGSDSSKDVQDYYYDKRMRLREDSDGNHLLTFKEGDKSHGYRFEQEEPISAQASEILKANAKLVIKKHRHVISLDCDGTGKLPKYKVTLDFIDNPMKLSVLEIEATDEGLYPIPSDIVNKLFGIDLKECPLSTWCLFNRKIGICGAPSCGKTETAKWMSHILNTRFGANSFHVVEFATSFIQKYKRNPNFQDQFFIWYGQRSREIDAQTADVIISDCPTFLSYIYMTLLNKMKFSEDSAMYLSKVYKRVLFDMTTYTDLVFLKLQDYTDNNIRYQSADESKEIEQRISGFLNDHNIQHIVANYNDGEKLLRDLFYINELGSV